jgi:hypothetical protein
MPNVSRQQIDSQHDFLVNARSVAERTIGQSLLRARGIAESEVPARSLSESAEASSESNDFSQATLHSVIGAVMRRNNIRSTVRLTVVPRNQVKAIVMQAGTACSQHHSNCLRQLRCNDLRCQVTLAPREKDRGPQSMKDDSSFVESAWVWTSVDVKTGLFHSGSSRVRLMKQVSS